MARQTGDKNADHDEVRLGLMKKLRTRLLKAGSDKVSFRELAQCAEVSVPTLRHYFGTRTGLLQQVFADLHREGGLYLRDASASPLDLKASMLDVAGSVFAGARFGRMDKVHTLGLTEGLGDSKLGPSYLDNILEPSLQAIEARLEGHRQRGEFNAPSTRHAALAFVAPLILALLHQKGLGGDCVRPLDLEGFAKDHVEAFVAAYEPSTKRGTQ